MGERKTMERELAELNARVWLLAEILNLKHEQ
jgi:hypothetical protein